MARPLRGALLAVVIAAALPAGVRAERLSLADAVRRAGTDAASVKVAGYGVDASEAKIAEKRAPLLPQLSAAASQSERTFNLDTFGIPIPLGGLDPLIGPVPTFDARVRVTQTIADLSEWKHVGSERSTSAATRADARTQAQDAAETAALRYSVAERAFATLEARRADLALATELDSLARIQLSAGTAANIDVLRSGTALAAARGEVVVAENAFERARIDLSRALGADAASSFELADSLGQAVVSDAPATREPAVAMALQHRSELLGVRSRLLAAQQERSAIASERIPRLDVAADYGASGLHADDALATRTAAVQLTWPIFDGARREARVREQVAAIGAAEVRARDLVDRITAEVSSALLDLESGRQQEGIADERVRLALETLDEARIRFRSGVANNIEILEAQAAILRARDAEIAARAATAMATIHLARATGVAETVR